MPDSEAYSAETVEVPIDPSDSIFRSHQKILKIEADAALAREKIEAANSAYPEIHGGSILGAMVPPVDQWKVAPQRQADDRDDLPPPPNLTPYAIAIGLVIALVVLGKWWMPKLSHYLKKIRQQPEAVIAIGLGAAAFDWRVLPHLIENDAIQIPYLATLHYDGWLSMASVGLALLGLYWKMRSSKNQK